MDKTTPPIPRLEPLLALRSGRFYYLCTYENAWDSQKGRSYRSSTTSVGKILSGRKDGEVEWKDFYLKKHPELRAFKTSRGADGALSFTPAEPDAAPFGALRPHLSFGATKTLWDLIKRSPLEEALELTFSRYSDWRKILSLAFFLVLGTERLSPRLVEFTKNFYLPWTQVITAREVRRLFSRITAQKRALFLSRLGACLGENSEVLVYCSSPGFKRHNRMSWSARAEFADEDGEGDRSCLMAVERDSCLPLCYCLMGKSRLTSPEALRAAVARLTRRDLGGRLMLIGDRGYAGPQAISGFLRGGLHFLVNPRTHHGIFDRIMQLSRRHLFALSAYHPVIGCAVFTKRVRWNWHLGGGRRRSALLWLHIYFDENVYNQTRERLKRGIGLVYEALERGDPLPEDLQAIRERYMRDDEGSGALKVVEEAVQLALDRRSVRLLLSDAWDDPVKAFCDYFDRNEIWAGFRTCRERLSSGAVLSNDLSDEDAKDFVQFLACAISLMLRRALSRAGSAVAGLPYNSDDVVLGMLSGIELNYTKRYGAAVSEPSRTLSALLEALNVDLSCTEQEWPGAEVAAAALSEERDYAAPDQAAQPRLTREELIYRRLS